MTNQLTLDFKNANKHWAQNDPTALASTIIPKDIVSPFSVKSLPNERVSEGSFKACG